MKNMKLVLILLCFQFCFLFSSPTKIENKPNPKKENIEQKEFRAYWIGHATVLIQMYDKWIITDPIWNQRLLGILPRHVEPGIELENIPDIDFILISHVHLDHLDNYSLGKLPKKANLVLPEGASRSYRDFGFHETNYVVPWQIMERNGIKITAVPAVHFGGRWLIDNFVDGEPYTGYIIEYKGKTVYFAGDTGYDSLLFKSFGEKYKIDLALIPVGPYRGKSIFGNELGNMVHVNPKGALQIFMDTKAKKMIPIHHGTFYSNPNTEIELVKSAISESDLSENIYLLKQGETVNFGIKD